MAKWAIFHDVCDWYKTKVYAYIMPRERSIEIDDATDWHFAEYMLARDEQKEKGPIYMDLYRASWTDILRNTEIKERMYK